MKSSTNFKYQDKVINIYIIRAQFTKYSTTNLYHANVNISDIGFTKTIRLIMQINWQNMLVFVEVDYNFSKLALYTFAIPTVETSAVTVRGYY